MTIKKYKQWLNEELLDEKVRRFVTPDGEVVGDEWGHNFGQSGQKLLAGKSNRS